MSDVEKSLFGDDEDDEIIEDSNKKLDVVDETPYTFDDVKPELDVKEEIQDNIHLLEDPPSYITALDWRFKDNNLDSITNEGQSLSSDDIETNTHLVEWDDGSIVLYVGTIPMDIKPRKEIAYLIEDSYHDIKPIHARIEERLQIRFSNLLKNKSVHRRSDSKRQKMTLTSIAEALSSEINLQKQMLIMRENERMRKIQNASVIYNKGLTRNFLESDDDDDQLS